MRNPPEIPFLLQLKYLTVYIAALLCALWMRFDPTFTFACLLAGPLFVLLSRISLAWFPPWLRQLVQLSVAAFATYWVQLRLTQLPIDSVMLELGVILLPALFISGSYREHGLLWFGALCYTGYGGLYPARSVFLPAFLTVLITSVFILYQTRINLLAKVSKKGLGNLSGVHNYYSSWFYRMLHFTAVLALVILISSQFSLRNKTRSIGLIPVSYRTDQAQEFPEIWQKWAAPSKELLFGDQGNQQSDSGNKPTIEDEKAENQMQDGSFSAEGEDGSGAGNLGQDLVFRAYTPAKLYWVMQLYDKYDGKEWTQSAIMTKGKNALDTYKSSYQTEVVQNISIVKPMSRLLPYAYKPLHFFWQESREEFTKPMGIIRKKDSVSYRLQNDKLPDLPWQYTVVSTVPDPERCQIIRAWREPVRNYGWNYRQLPRRQISERVQQLAEEITEDCETALDKALAIRDYLRENFTYNQDVAAAPDDVEITDYFLFESKQGICQHYAQALTLLARLAGLHSRLATGYSPGNYNLLANYFEIYEYHAHAWTQIFIEPFGWLTFDGSPPGALRLEENPVMLKPLLDPFESKWSVNTPELSARSPLPSQPGNLAQMGRSSMKKSSSGQGNLEKQSDIQKKIAAAYEEVYNKAIVDNLEMRPNAKQIAKAALQSLMDKGKESYQKATEELQKRIQNFKDKIIFLQEKILAWLNSLTLADLIVVLLSLSCLLFIWKKKETIFAKILWHWRLWQNDLLLKKIKKMSISNSEKITYCHNLLYNWLKLAGMKRPPYYDLLEYGQVIQRKYPFVFEEYDYVSDIAASVWYDVSNPENNNLADDVLAKTTLFRKKINPYLKHKRLRT